MICRRLGLSPYQKMCDCFLVKEHEDTVADLVETIPCRPVKLTPVIFPYLCSTSGGLYVCTSYHRVFAGTSKLSPKTQVKVVNGTSLVLVIFLFQNATPVYKDGLQVVSSKLFYTQPQSAPEYSKPYSVKSQHDDIPFCRNSRMFF